MHKLFNACLVLAVLISAFFLYSLEHTTRGLEREIAQNKARVSDEREAIKLLNAEWASLSRPQRLQKLAEEHLKLSSIKSTQLITEGELAQRVPAEPLIASQDAKQDPIGDIVKEMQQ